MGNSAFGRPGLPPNWSCASKQGVGTALNDSSRVWFTIAEGIVTEVFYPTVDNANIKDLQLLVTDGETFFEEERKDTVTKVERLDPFAPAYRVTNTARSGKYRIEKEIFTDPGGNSLVIRTVFTPILPGGYSLYVLLAPHLNNSGYGDTGKVVKREGREYLAAFDDRSALALSSNARFLEASCGYSGVSDGWQDLKDNFKLDWHFDEAPDGNVALIARLDASSPFTLVLSFGADMDEAIREADSTLGKGFDEMRSLYIRGWREYVSSLEPLGRCSSDGGRLFSSSAIVLKTHEDKTHRGGVIASLSIPWGEARTDSDPGGYHLVWPRDLVKAALAFMAAGDMEAAVRALKYLERTQREDGSWPQNMWLDGRPYRDAVQMDEVAFPVMLAWRLKRMGCLKEDFYPMVKRAASFIAKHGPVTEQERWEENSGFSPSTLAAEISALVCAAHWAADVGEEAESRYLFEIADYWQTRIEEWTYTDCGCVHPEFKEHYQRVVRIAPEALDAPDEACRIFVEIKNIPAAVKKGETQCAIVDGGFLELVRYGLRRPDDEHVLNTIPVVDKLLKVDTPYGPVWKRYNHDGYGEKPDGSPFDGSGVGRPWPLLTGERGMYELLSGRTVEAYIKALEAFAGPAGMLPEQVWDSVDIPEKGLANGRGTGSAAPLVWAHAEYIKLLRSRRDSGGCDIIAEVRERYSSGKTELSLTAWKRNKPIKRMRSKEILRVVTFEPSVLHWSSDNWSTFHDDELKPSGLGLYFHDFPRGSFGRGETFVFTIFYTGTGRWEGRDYSILVV